MKKMWLFLGGIAPAVLAALTGCMLFSLSPFYTDGNRVDVPPEVCGLWSGDRLHLKILPGGGVEYRSFGEKETVELELQAVFFRIDGSLYADISLVGQAPAIDHAVLLGVLAPVHNVYQIKMNGDSLTILWPDFGKLRELCRAGKVKLPHAAPLQKEDPPVFTASPQEWESVLRNHSGAIFSEKNAVRFQRVLVQ